MQIYKPHIDVDWALRNILMGRDKVLKKISLIVLSLFAVMALSFVALTKLGVLQQILSISEKERTSVSSEEENRESITLEDIQEMASDGTIDVVSDDNGKVRSIIGGFTDYQVNTASDAADALNSVSTLFGDSFHADEQDIVIQTLDDGNVVESFYRYAPIINGIPVFGSQIILSTDETGKANGVFSNYNETIETVDTVATLTDDEARSIAVEEFLQQDEIRSYLDIMTRQEDTDEIIGLFKKLLDVKSALIIYATDSHNLVHLTYAVSVSNFVFNDESKDDADTDNKSIDEINFQGNGDMDTENSLVMPISSNTYFILANGDAVGDILSVSSNIFNAISWQDTTYLGVDMNNHFKSVNVQERNGVYRAYDSKRKIKIYEIPKSSFFGYFDICTFPGKMVVSTTSDAFSSASFSESTISLLSNYSTAYDFYKALGRTSYDDHGSEIIVTLNKDNDRWKKRMGQNAFWAGNSSVWLLKSVIPYHQFVYTTDLRYNFDFCASLDVAGHEFTHAVMENIIRPDGLGNTFESGALNEAYADIMGMLIEGKQKTDDGRWTFAEDSKPVIVGIDEHEIVITKDSARSMANPSEYAHSEHYSQCDFSQDVHANAGVFNRAVYLMMTDDRNKDISDMTWAQVFYRSMFCLPNSAKFLDARGAIISSAVDYGFANEQLQAIVDAFEQVGISPSSHSTSISFGENSGFQQQATADDGEIQEDTPLEVSDVRFDIKSEDLDGAYAEQLLISAYTDDEQMVWTYTSDVNYIYASQEQGVGSGIEFNGNQVVFASNGHIYSLDKQFGTLLWDVDAKNGGHNISSSLQQYDDYLYYYDARGRFFIVDTNGSVIRDYTNANIPSLDDFGESTGMTILDGGILKLSFMYYPYSDNAYVFYEDDEWGGNFSFCYDPFNDCCLEPERLPNEKQDNSPLVENEEAKTHASSSLIQGAWMTFDDEQTYLFTARDSGECEYCVYGAFIDADGYIPATGVFWPFYGSYAVINETDDSIEFEVSLFEDGELIYTSVWMMDIIDDSFIYLSSLGDSILGVGNQKTLYCKASQDGDNQYFIPADNMSRLILNTMDTHSGTLNGTRFSYAIPSGFDVVHDGMETEYTFNFYSEHLNMSVRIDFSDAADYVNWVNQFAETNSSDVESVIRAKYDLYCDIQSGHIVSSHFSGDGYLIEYQSNIYEAVKFGNGLVCQCDIDYSSAYAGMCGLLRDSIIESISLTGT